MPLEAPPVHPSETAPELVQDHVSVITIESSTVDPPLEIVEATNPPTETLPADGLLSPEALVTPLLSGITTLQVESPPGVEMEENVGIVSPPKLQTSSPRFTQFIQSPQPASETAETDELAEHQVPSEEETSDWPPQELAQAEANRHITGMITPNISITRNEIIALNSVLGRIPQSFLQGTDMAADMGLSVSVIDNPPGPSHQFLSQSGTSGYVGAETFGHQLSCESDERPIVRAKRQRPRYSLKGSMFRKHPVLKLSATGPIDREKTPYKWWCRVCKLELSLLSRGILELLAHYRTESHLVKEHRVRMETPGMPLFDKYENELQGQALTNAKKLAKETYPIAPQLDPCRLLVGQDELPSSGVGKSPVETVISQICIIEIGLRNGGHLSCLTDIYDEVTQFAGGSGSAGAFNWSPHRLFVSFSRHFLIFLSLSRSFIIPVFNCPIEV